jgi:hypothetical protein
VARLISSLHSAIASKRRLFLETSSVRGAMSIGIDQAREASPQLVKDEGARSTLL